MPTLDVIPNFVVHPEAPEPPSEYVDHDPAEVDYANSEDEHIPVERIRCGNCNKMTPKDSTTCENCQKHIGKQQADPAMRNNLDAVMQGSSILVETTEQDEKPNLRGVVTTLRYNTIPVSMRQQTKSKTWMMEAKADAKNKWRKFVRNTKYNSIVEWFDDLPEEPRFEGDQLCKAYWASAKSQVKDRAFFEWYDQLLTEIEHKPMSWEARDKKFRGRMVPKYDAATLAANRQMAIDAGQKPKEPEPHHRNPRSIELRDEWLESRRQEQAAESATKKRPHAGWEQRWKEPSHQNWSSAKETWTERNWTAGPYSGRADWKSEPSSGSGGANPSDASGTWWSREQRGTTVTPPWRTKEEKAEEKVVDQPWGGLV